MNKENFRVLKEIVSLLQELEKRDVLISEEKTRITRIEEMRKDAAHKIEQSEIALKSFKERLLKVEQDIDSLATSIERADNALNMAKNEKEAELSQRQKEENTLRLAEADSEGFSLMEKLEEEESIINEKEEFLSGSQKTLTSISSEVEENNKPLMKEQEGFKGRILTLRETLNEMTLSKLDKVLKKKLTHGPLTKIESNSCFICGFKLTKVDQDQIEQHLKLKSCTSCERIFIPNSTLY